MRECGVRARQEPRAARYALVTPARDEEAYIDGMIRSIAAQTVPPARWIIVDDGSCDRTAEIVQAAVQRLSFLTLVRRASASCRLAGGEGAIPDGLRHLNLKDFDFLARFDADLLFPKDYIERILQKFRNNPRLGIAGGTLYFEKDGKRVTEKVPEVHVRGTLKMYRRECFEDIGGLTAQIGWDTLDEASAWAKGWETRSYEDIRVLHRRPTGGGIAASELYYQRGRAEYLTWSDPVFVLGKAVRLLARDLSIIKPAAYLCGFGSSYLFHDVRLQNPAIARVRRAQQHDTIKRMLGWHRKAQQCFEDR